MKWNEIVLVARWYIIIIMNTSLYPIQYLNHRKNMVNTLEIDNDTKIQKYKENNKKCATPHTRTQKSSGQLIVTAFKSALVYLGAHRIEIRWNV